MMKRFVLPGLVLSLAAACGDNLKPGGGGDDIDAAAIDATNPDAPTDGPPAATPSGTFSLLEAHALAPMAMGNVVAARGIQVGIGFSDPATAVPPTFDSMPGSPLGCKVFVYDTPQELATIPGANEGVVNVAINNPDNGPPDQTYPTCLFAAGAGYICPDLGSSQSPGAMTNSISVTNNVTLTGLGQAATMRLALTSTATFGAEDVGRYVKFAGTGNPGMVPLDVAYNAFPIIAVDAMDNKVATIGLPLPMAAVVPVTQGTFNTLAGVGPLPGLASPGQLADDATVTATFVAGNGSTVPGGNHFGNFMITWTGAQLGNEFTLDDTNANLLRNIPTNGTGFTISGGAADTAGGAVLNIVTTDTALPQGASPFTFPTPTAKRVNVRCAVLGNNTITVPDAVAAFLTPAMSGRTRVQATFVRATLGIPTPSPTNSVTPIAGHAVVGFTTP